MGGDMADHDMGSGDMAGHGGDSCGDSSMSMGCGGLSCASTLAFVHENMVMHHGMAIEFTCDVEVDFVRGMIPHHAGAVKMWVRHPAWLGERGDGLRRLWHGNDALVRENANAGRDRPLPRAPLL